MISPFGSHRRHSIAACFGSLTLLLIAIFGEVQADDPVEIALSLHPARIDPFAALPRLLPADPDLKPGNAAVVLNGLMAERQGLWNSWDTIVDDARLPVGDPRIAATEVAGIIPDMIRAGLIRDADWNHPVREVGANVYLGDMQMVRGLLERPLTIWIKQKLAERDLTAATEGIRTQLACARHMGAASEREKEYSCSGTVKRTEAFFAKGESVESEMARIGTCRLPQLSTTLTTSLA